MNASLLSQTQRRALAIVTGSHAHITQQQNLDALTYISNRMAADSDDGLTEIETRGLARILHLITVSAVSLAGVG